MRIALFVHCFFPDHFYGTETYTLDLAKGIQARGHDVTVVSAVPVGEHGCGEPLHRYQVEGVSVVSLDRNHNPPQDVRETYYQPNHAPRLREVLLELKPDVVHVTHLIHHTAALLEVVDELGIPSVATLTDFFGFCYTNRLEAVDGTLCAGPSPSRRDCVACYLRAGHGVAVGRVFDWASGAVTSRALARGLSVSGSLPGMRAQRLAQDYAALQARPDILRARYGSYRAMLAPTRFLQKAYEDNGFRDLTLSHFGIDIDRTAKPKRPPGDPVQIGYIGQMAPHKGVGLLLDAAMTLPQERFELQLYGSDDATNPYVADLQIRARGMPVQFRGTFERAAMGEVLRGLDVLVIPSTWYENSPLVLLYGLATHTPVVVADVEGLTEFVEDGKNGLHFRRGDAGSLARALRRLLEDPGRVATMTSQTSYERATADVAREVEALYQRLIPGIS